jgi:hypothetical protein
MNKKKEMQRIYLSQKEDGCILCNHLNKPQSSPTEIHHLRKGQGMSQRGKLCIPLCVRHHRSHEGYHGLGRRGFEKTYNVTEEKLFQEWQFLSSIDVDWSEL